MTNAELYADWLYWLVIAGVIVVAAAVLLILVWLAARRILKLAVVALDLVKQIKSNTNVIWALADTNKTAQNILVDAEAIRTHGASIAHALHEVDTDQNRAQQQG